MPRSRYLAIGLVVIAAAAAVLAFMLLRPSGLDSRPVDSVPPLLSEPAGVPGAGLVLAPSGLGPVTFGDAADEVLAKLTELLGDPVEDAPQPCPSDEHPVRWVRWGNLTISLPDGRFAGYVSGIYFPPDSPELLIKTTEGVGPHATGQEMVDAYGDRFAWLRQQASDFGDPLEVFGIDGYDPDHPGATGLGGLVEGGREDGRVITVLGGQPCGAAGQ